MQKLQFNTRPKGVQCEKLNLRKELYQAVPEFLPLSKNPIFPMFFSCYGSYDTNCFTYLLHIRLRAVICFEVHIVSFNFNTF